MLYKQVLYCLSRSAIPVFILGIFKRGSHELFAQGLASNYDLLDLCFLSSWDYHQRLALQQF
jgi:hypothetical protein